MSDNPDVILDSHVHLWDTTRLTYPWLSAEPDLPSRCSVEDVAAAGAGAGLLGWVFVEAGRRDDQALDEARWVHELALAGAPVIAVVAWVSLEDRVARTEGFAALADLPLVTGVRRNLQDEAAGFCRDRALIDGTRQAGASGLAVDLCVRQHQLAEVVELVLACPDTTFVLDHLGKPDIAAAGHDLPQPWADDLARLAAQPHVSCKLSGLVTEADPNTRDPANLGRFLHHAIELFGPHRSLFGSDWPVAGAATTYDAWLTTVIGVLEAAGLSRAERAAVLGENTRRTYVR